MTISMKLSDVAPTTEAARIVGETLDNFRHRARSDATFPVPIKIGAALFYRRKDLAQWKRVRDARRKRS